MSKLAEVDRLHRPTSKIDVDDARLAAAVDDFIKASTADVIEERGAR